MHRPSLDAKGMAMLFRKPREVAVQIVWKFWQDECPQRAAALAYTTLLALVPSLAVAFAMLKAFGGLSPIQERLETLVYTHLVTTSSLQAAEYIQKLTERVNAGAIGTVGFLAFIITAVSLLNTVADAFNRVWGVEDRRSLRDRFLTFFALTILAPILFGASISITGSIGRSAAWTRLPISGLGPALVLLVPFLLTWAGFLLLYEIIPSVPLRLRPAVFGSLAVAGSWELAKIGFELYVSTVVNYGEVYASLSVIPVFLLWLYVSWLIALLGFEVSFFLQHPELSRGATAPEATHTTVPIPEAIRAFVAMAEAFARGSEPVTVSQVAQQVRVPEGIALAILVELERHGYAARVARPDGAYLPRRSPASVKVAELWHALGGRMGLTGVDPLDQLLTGAADATTRAFGSTTVQDLLESDPAWSRQGASGPAREDLTELA